MQSLNILIRLQRLFLDAAAARLQVRLIKLDRVLSFDNTETEGSFFFLCEERNIYRAKFHPPPFFFSFSSSRRDRTDPITRIRFYFYERSSVSFQADQWKSWKFGSEDYLSLSFSLPFSKLDTHQVEKGDSRGSVSHVFYTSLCSRFTFPIGYIDAIYDGRGVCI